PQDRPRRHLGPPAVRNRGQGRPVPGRPSATGPRHTRPRAPPGHAARVSPGRNPPPRPASATRKEAPWPTHPPTPPQAAPPPAARRRRGGAALVPDPGLLPRPGGPPSAWRVTAAGAGFTLPGPLAAGWFRFRVLVRRPGGGLAGPEQARLLADPADGPGA